MSENRLFIRARIESNDAGTSPEAAASGRVVHDARGTAIWDWDVATAILEKTTTDELLRSLAEPGMLSLEGDLEPANDWSGDPYNRPAR